MNASQTMLRAAQLLEHDAECLKLSNTCDGEWVIREPSDEVAKRDHDERLKVAAALTLYAKVSA